ncbi:uncharacterized protein TrAtP1_005821 [Trichoderma atroviride]|uniref:uncharacterized protein n=1 Tax=Hypocrea atroviridis TaxID=63577 RepID=UPI00331BE344|nr:hypothetical protein TrAtP1_005821 [Trichoderma atroviride]
MLRLFGRNSAVNSGARTLDPGQLSHSALGHNRLLQLQNQVAFHLTIAIPDTSQPSHRLSTWRTGTASCKRRLPLPEDIANKRITSVEDQINSADVSVSGGSDTEASRAKDGDKGQVRAGASTKKPATFKAVSVNKTFLASKANPNVSSKTSDKPAAGSSTPPTGSATLSISRPRLVAKSGSGTGSSTPRFSSLANGGKPAAAPDPSVVWNKNRPTPVPEPKKLTDEELKKYGIHMASRLNEDDTQGQNKWADIDDDDDDWEPEAITWGDGTKTTLPHPDEVPIQAPERAPDEVKPSVQDKPSSPAPPGVANVTPLPKSGGLPSGKGLVLKSAAQEKPVLVAKPPRATSARQISMGYSAPCSESIAWSC